MAFKVFLPATFAYTAATILLLNTAPSTHATTDADQRYDFTQMTADWVFILDRSDPVGEEVFVNQSKHFLRSLLQLGVHVHPEYTRIAVISYAEHTTLEMDSISTKEQLVECQVLGPGGLLDHLHYRPPSSPDTTSATDVSVVSAMELASRILHQGRSTRDDVIQEVWLVSDAQHFGVNAIAWSNYLKNDDVTIIGVGVGLELDGEKLEHMTSQPYSENCRRYDEWMDVIHHNMTEKMDFPDDQWYPTSLSGCQTGADGGVGGGTHQVCGAGSGCYCTGLHHYNTTCMCHQNYAPHGDTCTHCEDGTYKDIGNTTCEECPKNVTEYSSVHRKFCNTDTGQQDDSSSDPIVTLPVIFGVLYGVLGVFVITCTALVCKAHHRKRKGKRLQKQHEFFCEQFKKHGYPRLPKSSRAKTRRAPATPDVQIATVSSTLEGEQLPASNPVSSIPNSSVPSPASTVHHYATTLPKQRSLLRVDNEVSVFRAPALYEKTIVKLKSNVRNARRCIDSDDGSGDSMCSSSGGGAGEGSVSMSGAGSSTENTVGPAPLRQSVESIIPPPARRRTAKSSAGVSSDDKFRTAAKKVPTTNMQSSNPSAVVQPGPGTSRTSSADIVHDRNSCSYWEHGFLTQVRRPVVKPNALSKVGSTGRIDGRRPEKMGQERARDGVMRVALSKVEAEKYKEMLEDRQVEAALLATGSTTYLELTRK